MSNIINYSNMYIPNPIKNRVQSILSVYVCMRDTGWNACKNNGKEIKPKFGYRDWYHNRLPSML